MVAASPFVNHDTPSGFPFQSFLAIALFGECNDRQDKPEGRNRGHCEAEHSQECEQQAEQVLITSITACHNKPSFFEGGPVIADGKTALPVYTTEISMRLLIHNPCE